MSWSYDGVKQGDGLFTMQIWQSSLFELWISVVVAFKTSIQIVLYYLLDLHIWVVNECGGCFWYKYVYLMVDSYTLSLRHMHTSARTHTDRHTLSLSLSLSRCLSLCLSYPLSQRSHWDRVQFSLWLVWLSATVPDGCRTTLHCLCAANHGEHLSPVCRAPTAEQRHKHLRSDQHPQGNATVDTRGWTQTPRERETD